MSNSTRPPEPPPAGAGDAAAGRLVGARIALALLYPLLVHLAGARHDGRLAALALADIAVIVLLEPLLHRRARAWLLLAVVVAALAALARTPYAQLPLLLVPVAIVALVAWGFARTLRPGRVPLIARIVAAMDGVPAAALAPDLRAYTRALTRAWAGLMAALALVNLVLAACATPGGLLAGFGIASPVAVTHAQWSWFANVCNYGIVAAFFVLEFAYRSRRFPGRYRSFWDFLAKLARLGPAFWRGVLR